MKPGVIRRAWPWALVALVALLSLANAWRYADRVANPLVHADSWYFLDAFVEPWEAGELGWREFFLKRGGSDHAQPLHRLSLLWNLETQRLDFRAEARWGLAGLTLQVALLLGLAIAHLRRREAATGTNWPPVVALALVPAMALSLNSHEIYYWSLVAFFHLSLLPALGMLAVVCWRFRPGQAPPAPRWIGPLVAVLSFVVQLALDGAGALAVVALVPVLAWTGWRQGCGARALGLIGWMLVGLAAYRWSYDLLLPLPETEAGSTAQAIAYLLAHWHEAGRWLLLPAAASLVYPMHLPFWVDAGSVPALRTAIGVLAVSLHTLFWWSLARDRAPAALSLFAAALMLLVYGMVAGIVLSRVPVFGSDYLLQSRYVAFYQLANLALVLQWVAVLARTGQGDRAIGPAVALVVSLGLGLQVLLSMRAWDQAPHIRQYIRDMAGNVLCLAAHPGLQAPVCQPGNAICAAPAAERDRLVELLQRQQLNLFAPGFLQRHDLESDVDSGSCLAPAG